MSAAVQSVAPMLSVHDMTETLVFYQQILGFELAWSWGAPPEIAAVCCGDAEITLTARRDAKPVGASHIYLRVVGVDRYHDALVASGVKVLVPIDDRAYGMRDFRIADPSGNQISIGEATSGAHD
ncbi:MULTISPECIES: VOC family protein [Luteimonas]|uniref:VOC family protein n=1 Tax=Luteimonas TaxID=83614 RepID=UPI000C7E6DBC|nr:MULTISPECIES: glyoxalase superfamily protein [Luteimonas]